MVILIGNSQLQVTTSFIVQQLSKSGLVYWLSSDKTGMHLIDVVTDSI